MKPGDVTLVRFPFTDLAATKKRPALILARAARARRYRLVTVAMITSQVEALKIDGDVFLDDWESAGLIHPSILRMAKIATVDGDLVDKNLGRLSARDIDAATRAFRSLFSTWI